MFLINICLLVFKRSHTWAVHKFHFLYEYLYFPPLFCLSNVADIQIKICNTFKIDKYKILSFHFFFAMQKYLLVNEKKAKNLIYEFLRRQLISFLRDITWLSCLHSVHNVYVQTVKKAINHKRNFLEGASLTSVEPACAFKNFK